MGEEHRKGYRSLWATVQSLTPKLGCVPKTLNEWGKRAGIDAGAPQQNPYVERYSRAIRYDWISHYLP